MRKHARKGTSMGLLAVFILAACAHQEPVTVHAPVETLPATKVEQAGAAAVLVSPPPEVDDEKTTALKTWLSREEVEAAREAGQQHARDMQSFWAMRKDRESLRPTNIGPGGTCVCFGGDPLCSCR